MTPLEVLQKARERIAQGWTQCSFARTQTGSPCDSGDKRAVTFCAAGAINASSPPSSVERSEAHRLLGRVTLVSTMEFNDKRGRTQAEVLAAFDAAIAKAKEGHND